MLLRNGREIPLIPRYFDLLVFLVERRGDAVHRRDIFDRVWNDVIVSDSALSQAIRTIRRALDDDSRDPRFIRTVSRHGYRFVFADVVEEADDGEWPQPALESASAKTPSDRDDPFERLLERLTRTSASPADEEDRREAAELLHTLGTDETLRRLGTRPHHALARAVLRDARWDVPAAGPVPIVGQPSPFAVAREVVQLRLRRGAALAARRWASASVGAGFAGLVGGAVGGMLLVLAPDSVASLAVVPVLGIIGGTCGAAGGAGVGAGLSVAEAVIRSRRVAALALGAAAGGALAGGVAQWVGRWTLAALVGVNLAIGGAIEGLLIGAAAGAGYGAATAHFEGLAAPRGQRRFAVAAITAIASGLATLAISLTGRPLVGGTIHLIAQSSAGSQATLTPLGHLIGEPGFGAVTSAILATGEGALFGLGLALGLTHRPADRTRPAS